MHIHKFWPKYLISFGAAVFLLIHVFFPKLTIDAITFGFFIAITLPWLSDFIKSAEFPGGWKLEFRDLQSAGDKITKGAPLNSEATPQPSYLEIASRDPNLALVGLRIEIEIRLRALARKNSIKDNIPLGQLLMELERQKILDIPSIRGLRQLIDAGNHAAHGAKFEEDAASWAFDSGPQILAVLDANLKI